MPPLELGSTPFKEEVLWYYHSCEKTAGKTKGDGAEANLKSHHWGGAAFTIEKQGSRTECLWEIKKQKTKIMTREQVQNASRVTRSTSHCPIPMH